MASQHRITCIIKSDRDNPHERILKIGGKNENGSTWILNQEDAIKGIENGNWAFYVEVEGRKVWVMIARSAQGNKYLKTEADGVQPNNLLSLPDCS